MATTLINMAKWLYRNVLLELAVLIIFIFCLNNYVGLPPEEIRSDGMGYYDYLPSAFIYHDFSRKDAPPQAMERVNKTGVYVPVGNKMADKYPVGVALLSLPFFGYAYATTPVVITGYEKEFDMAMYHSALFYLFFALVFLRRLLLLYNINRFAIFICQLFMVMATPVVRYAPYEPSFSHIYSLFAITAFMFFAKHYFYTKNTKNLLYAAAFLGLVMLLRQVNILVLLFIPFLAGSYANLKQGLALLLKKPLATIGAAMLVLAVFSIQMGAWYAQTGNWYIDSYPNEHFNFLKPELFNILFSYKKGLFVYTPLLVVCLLGLIPYIKQKNYYALATWAGFFFVLTYVLSAWWCWYYGCSYGQRPYIDFLALFFIPLGLLLNSINRWGQAAIITTGIALSVVNFIQVFQYKKYILHYDNMDADKYWNVFLKTDPFYYGVIWKSEYNYNLLDTLYNQPLQLDTVHNPEQVFFKADTATAQFGRISLVQLSFDNTFNSADTSIIVANIIKTKNNANYYWHYHQLLWFANGRYNHMQRGLGNFHTTMPTDSLGHYTLLLKYKGATDIRQQLRNGRVILLGNKP